MIARAAAGDLQRLLPREVVWHAPDGADVDLAVTADATATIAQLAQRLLPAPDDLVINGVRYAASDALAPVLRRGSDIRPAGAAGAPSPVAELELVIVGGLQAGRSFPLRSGVLRLGRAGDNDIVLDAATVSAHHAVLTVSLASDVTLTDLESTNGCRIEGRFLEGPTRVIEGEIIQLGAVQVMVRRRVPTVAVLGDASPEGGRYFNRPPRLALPPAPAPVPLPPAAAPVAPRTRLGWAAMAAPLLFGLGMAVFFDPRFAAFALFSPAMMLGTWLEDRRRVRRESRAGSREMSAELDRLRVALADAVVAHREHQRRLLPDPALAAARLRAHDVRLWERRPGAPDFGRLTLGLGPVAWIPPTTAPPDAASEALRMVAELDHLDDAPVPVDLASGRAVGLVGAPDRVSAVLRSLVLQAAALHGPADLRIAVLTTGDRAGDWDWVKWLPHTAMSDGIAVAADAQAQARLVDALLAGDDRPALTVVVCDAEGLTEGRSAVARPLLDAEGVAVLVSAPAVQRLPATCVTVVELHGEDGRATCEDPSGNRRVSGMLVAGVETAVAREAALAAAAVADPEAVVAGQSLPERVGLLDLLQLPAPTPAALLDRWRIGGVAVPIGVGEHGPVVVDLAVDGPHGLLAGTTGAGKSELLRTLVAGLAATAGPDELTFVLIDYKGGSAFDECALLPHTVGLVTDLDEALGRRALRCLEAELRHRERVLRAAGAPDIEAYRRDSSEVRLAPLPRLVVIVDEFAALAAELPEFLDRLVAVAQRGRSLGVHLLLATQRPAGAVSDAIRANMNLRISLRVHDAADSADVIGTPQAAQLNRRLPGRGYLRLGPGEVTGFQAALVTGVTAPEPEPVDVRPFAAAQGAPDVCAAPDETRDLTQLVTAARAAFEQAGMAPPRRPWPAPLPAAVTLEEVAALDARPVIGLLDDPDRQRRDPLLFDPLAGSLLLYGGAGSGTTEALATIALALTDRGVDCYVIDAGSQRLSALADLPHVGAVVGAGERERAERLVRFLAEELAQRRVAVAAGEGNALRSIVVLLDNYAGFAAGFDDLHGLPVLDTLARVVADGPALGVSVVCTADRPTAIPAAMAATAARRLVFRLPDRLDYSHFGILPADAGELPPCRAIDPATGVHVHIAEPADGVPAAVAARADGVRRARAIDVMPAAVPLGRILDAAEIGEEWFLPLGLGDAALQPAGWTLGPGDHGLITGPSRSGKSTLLTTIVAVAAKHRPDLRLLGVAPRRSPLRECLHLEQLLPAEASAVVDLVGATPGPVLLVIDDADSLDDPRGDLAALLAERRDDVHVVATGRADVLRVAYGHWTTELRRSRLGVALRPNLDLDGDLWHVALPRQQRGPFPAGRGFLVADGSVELIQTAQP